MRLKLLIGKSRRAGGGALPFMGSSRPTLEVYRGSRLEATRMGMYSINIRGKTSWMIGNGIPTRYADCSGARQSSDLHISNYVQQSIVFSK